MTNMRARAPIGLAALLWLALYCGFAGTAAAVEDPLTGSNQKALTAFLAADDEFLPVDEAYRFDARMDADGSVHARWAIADGYYLYRHSLKMQTADPGVTIGQLSIPPGESKHDEYFGDSVVYHHDLSISAPLLGDLPERVTVAVSYQGCAEAGLCYPPETRWVRFEVPRVGSSGGEVLEGPPTEVAAASTKPAAAPGKSESAVTEEARLAALLGSASFGYALLVFFLAGIGLAFTPCVLPMVPILSSIIVGQEQTPTRIGAFTLSLAYVLGMALTYALLGVLMGLFGASMNLQAALQSPPVLVAFAAVFAALSLSMFGFYELRLPAGLEQRLTEASQRFGGGKHAPVFVMGALSALIVSPCVSAPLAAALIHISGTGDAVYGGLALLALGLGMGTPLILIGTGGGHLLPRAGAWMDAVKAVFGVLLLGVAIWLLERVLPGPVTLLLWGALLVTCGVFLGALDFSPRRGWAQLWKATGALGLVWGTLLVIGAASGASDPLRPLGRLVGEAHPQAGIAKVEFAPVDDLASLRLAVADAAARGQPVLLDLYADWCISCKIMERSVFTAPAVARQLANFVLLRADVTGNDDADRELLEAYGLFGPPSLLLFDIRGSERTDYRVQGEIDAAGLEALLARFLSEQADPAAIAAN